MPPAPRPASQPSLSDVWVLFAGDALSVLGAYFNIVAVAALTFSLSHSAPLMSLQIGAAAMTGIGAAPLAGAWADRARDRRFPMLAADLWRAGTAYGMVFAHSPWQLAVLASLTAVGGAVYGPARGALMVQLVGRDDIARWNGWRSVTVGASRLAGPAIAGLVLARWGIGPAFAANAAGYLVSAAATAAVRLRPASEEGGPITPAARAHRRAAVEWIAGDSVVRGALAVWAWVAVGTWCVNTMWFVWVQKVHFGGPVVMGAAIAAYEGGSIVAGAALIRIRGRSPSGPIPVVAAGIAACWCALAFAHSSAAILALSALEGVGAWWLRLLVPTLIQQRAPEAVLGGALAVESQLDDAGDLAGVGLAAAAGTWSPPPAGFLTAATVAVVGCLATLAFLRLARTESASWPR